MLKTRILTALVLAPLMMAGIGCLPTPTLAWILGGLVLLAAWEWSRLAGFMTVIWGQIIYTTLILLIISGFAYAQWDALPWILTMAGIWIIITGILAYYSQRPTLVQWPTVLKQLLGIGVIPATWLSALQLHQQAPALLLGVLVMIWIADSAAYFAGRRFGRVKLAPVMSPGKTREGVYGALLATLNLAALGIAAADRFTIAQSTFLLVLCGITVLVSIAGDLLESVLKRQAQMKDSSQLLPGHGGILDRIDSSLAALPVFTAGWLWLGLSL